MRCPDCGETLTEVTMGANQAHRCFKCGGWWVDSWAVNRLTNETLSMWNRVSADPIWFSGGSGVCPFDGSKLRHYEGESVPPQLQIKRCDRCGKWWFHGDTLFEYKPATEAKINYYRLWGRLGDVASLGLPVLVIAMLMFGLGVGVYVSRQRQQVAVPAQSLIRNFSATYAGDGEEIISWRSEGKVEQIEYKKVSDFEFRIYEVKGIDGVYVVRLTGLEEGQEYVARILGEEYYFLSKL